MYYVNDNKTNHSMYIYFTEPHTGLVP